MNWDDYRYFLAVARSGRLSNAGRQLGVDHATVGRRIKALEVSLGANLFDRSPQGYRLTDAGQRLIDIAEDMETAAIGATAEIGGKDSVISGTVRVGAPEGVAAYVLAEAATEICRAHPQLELQVVALPAFRTIVPSSCCWGAGPSGIGAKAISWMLKWASAPVAAM